MKKLIFAVTVVLALTSCTGGAPADKRDEKGHNPSPEQIIAPTPCPIEVADTVAVSL